MKKYVISQIFSRISPFVSLKIWNDYVTIFGFIPQRQSAKEIKMNPQETSENSEELVSASSDSDKGSEQGEDQEQWHYLRSKDEEVSTVNIETVSEFAELPQKRKERTWSISLSNQMFSAAKDLCEKRGLIMDSLTAEDISEVAAECSRTPEQCLTKIREILVSGSLRAGVWSRAEDELLTSAVESDMNWRDTANYLNAVIHGNLKVRTSKHCKERWNNHLNPHNLKGNWTPAQDLLLMNTYKTYKNKWITIAKIMQNRSENTVKNRVHSLLHKIKQKEGIEDNDVAIQRIIQKLKRS